MESASWVMTSASIARLANISREAIFRVMLQGIQGLWEMVEVMDMTNLATEIVSKFSFELFLQLWSQFGIFS
jgi:hypothetical protein